MWPAGPFAASQVLPSAKCCQPYTADVSDAHCLTSPFLSVLAQSSALCGLLGRPVCCELACGPLMVLCTHTCVRLCPCQVLKVSGVSLLALYKEKKVRVFFGREQAIPPPPFVMGLEFGCQRAVPHPCCRLSTHHCRRSLVNRQHWPAPRPVCCSGHSSCPVRLVSKNEMTTSLAYYLAHFFVFSVHKGVGGEQ